MPGSIFYLRDTAAERFGVYLPADVETVAFLRELTLILFGGNGKVLRFVLYKLMQMQALKRDGFST